MPRLGNPMSRWMCANGALTCALCIARVMTAECALLTLALVDSGLASAQSSICAEVKIQIDQKVSLERQGFDAVLRINNALENVSVDDIDVNVIFKNQAGDPVVASSDPGNTSAAFFIRKDWWSGTGDLDGSGGVPPSTTAEAHWLIIPAQGTGGTLPTGALYQVGATVTYRMSGDPRSVEVTPETITVRPQPLLDLDYFLPGDVYADDPFTPQIEPPVPFTLGVRIQNNGGGLAAHTTIESAQPRIIDNDQGLLIGFQIDSSYLDDQPAQPTLLIDFGDIDPGQTRVGRWVMTTTLSGEFTQFDAQYTHADALGGALTSLVGTVRTHQLIHDVRVDLPGRDGIRDFLALDGDVLRAYESSGVDSELTDQTSSAALASGGSSASLTFAAMTAGLAYARVADPFSGQQLTIGATRSDGKVLPAENVWFSKHRNGDNSWSYYLNLFDSNPGCDPSGCVYALAYDGSTSGGSLTGFVYSDVNANGTRDTDEPGLTAVGITLTDGHTTQSVVSAADGSFSFANLEAGTYSVSVGAVGGYYDGLHTAGSAGGTPGTSSIEGIVLGPVTQATGYLFAKLAQHVDRAADLAINSLTASTAAPRVNETFALNLQVANNGPDSAPVDVGLTLPTSLVVISAAPSIGSFDSATGHWSVGDLQTAATVTLSFEVRAQTAGNLAVAAVVSTVDASVLDPNVANNATSVALDVEAESSVQLSASFSASSRILALVSCPAGSGPQCESDRKIAFDRYLTARGSEHLLTSDVQTFRSELRSGHWSLYWIDNGARHVDAALVAELSLALTRGEAVIVDGARDAGSTPLDSLLGVSYQGKRPQADNEPVTFGAGSPFNFPGLLVSGQSSLYQATAGTSLAQFADGAPAVFSRQLNPGHAYLFAFDLVGALVADPSYAPLFDGLAQASAPPAPTFFTADAYAALAMRTQNAGSPVSVVQVLDVPEGAHINGANPTPETVTPQHAKWNVSLVAGVEFIASAALRTQKSGTAAVAIDVADATSGASLAHHEANLTVHATNSQEADMQAAIQSLTVSGVADKVLKVAASAALDAALSARAHHTPELAIAGLLTTDVALTQIASADVTSARTALAWLLQAYEREWYVALSSCMAGAGTVVADDGMSFTAFDNQEGLLMSQSKHAYEWRLGPHTLEEGGYATGSTPLVNARGYQWRVLYAPAGGGTLTVNDGATVLSTTNFSPTSESRLRAANAVRMQAFTLPGLNTASIAVNATEVDSAPVTGSVTASGKLLPTSSSLYYYGDRLGDGFSLAGTVTVKSSGTLPRVGFTVNAGSVSCSNGTR